MNRRQAGKIIDRVWRECENPGPIPYSSQQIRKAVKKSRLKSEEKTCEHVNYYTVWERIPGEVVEQPSYDFCEDCGERF